MLNADWMNSCRSSWVKKGVLAEGQGTRGYLRWPASLGGNGSCPRTATGRSLLIVVAIVLICGAPDRSPAQSLECMGPTKWRTLREGEVWWLLNPSGERFFSIGVNAVLGGSQKRHHRGRIWYSWSEFYPDFYVWLLATRIRLKEWGFNTLGAWSVSEKEFNLPFTPELDLGRNARFHWFDPFDPETQQRVRQVARVLVAPYKGNPRRIGYFSDNEVGWWNGPLFVYYIQKPSSNKTKLRLVEFLREHYRGDWNLFTRDFKVSKGIKSFGELAATGGTEVLLRPGGGGIQAVRGWTRIVAEHYYKTMWEALREADPEGLVLGDRLPIYYDPEALKAMIPYVDVISVNYNVDSPDGWLARYFFDGLRTIGGSKPVLITEWFFAAHENRTGNKNLGHLITVPTQRERALGASRAAENFARNPQVVGIHWFQYWDHPKGGRLDGEDYNFGLVDINDMPYEELVQALAEVNGRLPNIHAESKTPKRPPRGALKIPRATIDTRDKHLADWPKDRALLPPLEPSLGEIAFGDLMLAWDDQNLFGAIVAMDYQDPELLDFVGEFPLDETFRVDLGVDAGRGARRFRLYVIPPPRWEDIGADTYRMYVKLVAQGPNGSWEGLRGGSAIYFGSDQPRIVVEFSIPWEALGLDGPPKDRIMKVGIAVTAFYNSRWMSLGGLSPERAMADKGSWKEAALVD